MERSQEPASLWADENIGARAAIARAHRTCKICGKPAVFFNSRQAELQYKFSLVCQSCQEYGQGG